jgi:hypothetical protein
MKIVNRLDFSNTYLTYFLCSTFSFLTRKKIKWIELKRKEYKERLKEVYYLHNK